jgi:hypothetical protein
MTIGCFAARDRRGGGGGGGGGSDARWIVCFRLFGADFDGCAGFDGGAGRDGGAGARGVNSGPRFGEERI